MKFNNKKLNDALDKVISVRNQRQKIYGDNWLNDPIEYYIYMLYGKIGRLLYLLKSNKTNKYETAEDTIIDIINYGLFALTILGENEK